MVVLGIETTCDESAAAVVGTTPAGPKILSNTGKASSFLHLTEP